MPKGELRRISINSFGYGGTNGHCIMDGACAFLESRKIKSFLNCIASEGSVNRMLTQKERIEREDVQNEDNVESEHPTDFTNDKTSLLVLSAADQAGVSRVAGSLKSYLEAENGKDLSESELLRRLVYTTSKARSSFPWKAAITFSSTADLIETLSKPPQPLRNSSPPTITFVFTGQGAQWPGMARELLCHPVFQRSMMSAAKHFKTLGASWDLIGKLRAIYVMNSADET